MSQQRGWESTIHRALPKPKEGSHPPSSIHKNLPQTAKNNYHKRQKSHILSDEIQNNAETIRTVEDKLRQKYSTSPSKNQQSLKRFKQLQEYLKMSHRDVKINQNIRNAAKRLVTGEIPLGTDTQIKHEIRESYPQILEIKRRLKNWLSINCNFNEVLKYASQYFGIDVGEQSPKRMKLDEQKKLKIKQAQPPEDSIKLFHTTKANKKRFEMPGKENRDELNKSQNGK